MQTSVDLLGLAIGMRLACFARGVEGAGDLGSPRPAWRAAAASGLRSAAGLASRAFAADLGGGATM
jgi:hypothetical protein